MKILRTMIILIIFILTSTSQVNTLASSSVNFNREINNVAVIFHRGDDPYMMRIRESLENIQKENQNNVNFTFFDAKNNIAIQNEIIDSALKSNFDLLILNLADKDENTVENILYNVRQKNIPVILMNIPSEVVSKVSKLYNKAAFVAPDSTQAGISQGKILVDLWNSNKKSIDKSGDDILQYILLQGEVDDPQAINRTKYSLSTLTDSGIKIEQLELINAGWLKDLAKPLLITCFLGIPVRLKQ